jgi:hypothetical protein
MRKESTLSALHPDEAQIRSIQATAPVSRSDHKFHVTMAIAIMITVFWGFAPSYYFKPFAQVAQRPAAVETHSLPILIHVHAVAFSAWILLLLCQTTLVATGRTGLHRRLGVASAAVAPLLVVLGFLVAIKSAQDGWNPGEGFPDSLAFMAVGLGDLVLFSSFVAAGLYYRRRPELHKRLMFLGTIGGLTWPAITRMPYIAPRPGVMFGLLAALVMAAPVRDLLRTRRLHPASIWGGIIILASFPIRRTIAMSGTWHIFAEWLTH